MAHWAQITVGATHNGGFINLDDTWSVVVIPTIADPTKFQVVVYENGGAGFETLVTTPTVFTSASAALAAAEELLSNFAVN